MIINIQGTFIETKYIVSISEIESETYDCDEDGWDDMDGFGFGDEDESEGSKLFTIDLVNKKSIRIKDLNLNNLKEIRNKLIDYWRFENNQDSDIPKI